MSVGSPDNKYPVKSLIKALVILEFLGTSESGSTLTEISSKLRIGKSTVHRLLATLRNRDFVWFDSYSSRYILGARILQLSQQLAHQSILIRYGRPILSELSSLTGETCNLAILNGRSVLYLVTRESKNPLRMTGIADKKIPAHCTALGKALLSSMSPEEITGLYGKTQSLETMTERSVSNVSELTKQLAKLRRLDVVSESEETYPGLTCLAARVRARSGDVVAAISISVPLYRIDAKRRKQLGASLQEACLELSGKLGYDAEHLRASEEVDA